MSNQNFNVTLLVDQTPEEVFYAVTDVRKWWSGYYAEEIEGSTEKLNDEFKYHYEDVHRSHMKLIEVIPDKKVVWFVVDNYFKFTQDKSEWTGTKIIFEIAEKDNKTEMRFTHQGLVPAYECYEICRDAWTGYIQKSLRNFITTGKGQTNTTGKPSY